MKKNYLLAILAGFLALVSCRKNSDSVEFTSGKLKEILTMDNVMAQRSAYTMLTPDEKAVIWKMHLSDQLKKYNGHKEKQNYINSVIGLVRRNMFDPREKQQFEGYFAECRYIANQLFTQVENYFLFYSLGIDNSPIERNSDVAMNSIHTIGDSAILNGSGKSCSCNAGQINTCTQRFLGGFIYCAKNNICIMSTSGCGWFWVNECNGECKTVTYLEYEE
ncbi:MAG: bacteriocin fulvocin C-related protein [Chitinophagaceae bacterium]